MAGRIEEHSKAVTTRLNLRLAGTDPEHGHLTCVEIINVEIEVQLLRPVVARPRRRFVARRLLECDRHAIRAHELDPVGIVARRLTHIPAGDRGVEARQLERLRGNRVRRG